MPNETIRENRLFLTLSLPGIDWLEEYIRQIADAYRSYALRPAGEMPICRMNVSCEVQGNIASLIIDVEESREEGLLVYRRLAQNWSLSDKLLLSDRRLLKLTGHKLFPKADGYYFRGGQLTAFRNLFRPGMEQGLRRSAWRQFIAEFPLS